MNCCFPIEFSIQRSISNSHRILIELSLSFHWALIEFSFQIPFKFTRIFGFRAGLRSNLEEKWKATDELKKNKTERRSEGNEDLWNSRWGWAGFNQINDYKSPARFWWANDSNYRNKNSYISFELIMLLILGPNGSFRLKNPELCSLSRSLSKAASELRWLVEIRIWQYQESWSKNPQKSSRSLSKMLRLNGCQGEKTLRLLEFKK